MLLFDVHPVLDVYEVAEVARVVAFALSRLHAGGRVHGRVDAQHIAADESGAVTLLPGPGVGTPADDVRALGELILDLLATARPAAQPPPADGFGSDGPVAAAPLPRPRTGRPPLPGVPVPGARRPSAPLAPPGGAAGRLLGRVASIGRDRRTAPVPPAEEALLAIARQACPEDGSPPVSAAAVAAQLALRVPDARPPGRRPVPPDRALGQAAAVEPPQRLFVTKFAAGLAAAAVFVVVALGLSAVRQQRQRPVEMAPMGLSSARGEAAFSDGVLTTPDGRYAVGDPADVVLIGDWFCRGSPVPALLRPSTGEVFVFDGLPDTGTEVTGRPVGRVPGATALRDRARPDGCPALSAVLADGTSVELPVTP